MNDRRLIEEWLPIAELGIESTRERTPMTPFPAPNRLHVWWARRPLVASRAAVLASLLPADTDRERFKHVLGIHGDPVAARRALDKARRTKKRIENGGVRLRSGIQVLCDRRGQDLAGVGCQERLEPVGRSGSDRRWRKHPVRDCTGWPVATGQRSQPRGSADNGSHGCVAVEILIPACFGLPTTRGGLALPDTTTAWR